MVGVGKLDTVLSSKCEALTLLDHTEVVQDSYFTPIH